MVATVGGWPSLTWRLSAPVSQVGAPGSFMTQPRKSQGVTSAVLLLGPSSQKPVCAPGEGPHPPANGRSVREFVVMAKLPLLLYSVLPLWSFLMFSEMMMFS